MQNTHKKIEVALQKRTGKFKLYIAGAIFISWILVMSTISLVTNPFTWTATILPGLMLFGTIGIGIALYDYYTQKEARLVASSDGQTMQFYISHSTGTANESEGI